MFVSLVRGGVVVCAWLEAVSSYWFARWRVVSTRVVVVIFFSFVVVYATYVRMEDSMTILLRRSLYLRDVVPDVLYSGIALSLCFLVQLSGVIVGSDDACLVRGAGF